MRKKIVAGNWKMNTTVPEGVQLAKEVVAKAGEVPADVNLILAVPYSHLCPVGEVIKGTRVALSAQNCSDKEKGAYTGEVSASMVKSTGAVWTILGQSECRQYAGDTDATLVEKIKLAFANNLKVILCVGEKLAERDADCHFEVVSAQVKSVLYHFSAEDMKNVVIAYEPIWAIGTGKTATAAQAQEIHACIRKVLADKFGSKVADDTTILYGGSCKPSNAKELFAEPDIDGGLIGGAALKAEDFIGIAMSF